MVGFRSLDKRARLSIGWLSAYVGSNPTLRFFLNNFCKSFPCLFYQKYSIFTFSYYASSKNGTKLNYALILYLKQKKEREVV